MKKYLVLERIGNLMFALGIVLLLCFACIDPDTLSDIHLVHLLLFLGVCILVSVVGLALSSLSHVEGVMYSCHVVMFAWMHAHFKKSNKLWKKCYRIKMKAGTYSDTYRFCRETYQQYIDSFHKES